MTPERTNHSAQLLPLAVRSAGLLAVIVGGVVLTGWALDVAALKSVLPGWVSMKPNTALAFIMTGSALLLSFREQSAVSSQRSAFVSRVARACALLAGLIGVLTLCEYVFGWNPGFDQWLFPEPPGTVGTSHPGRMAPETAGCFALLAAALWIIGGSRKMPRALLTAPMLGLLVTTLALAAMLTYVTPTLGAYGWWGLTIMAVPTAATFAVLGLAVIAMSWQRGALSWTLSKKTTVAFAVGLALLVVIGLNTSRSQVRLRETGRHLAHSEQVLGGIASIRAEVARAQNHTRGYVITGDERFLRSYLLAAAACNGAMDAQRQLVADNPRQQLQIMRLEALVKETLQWFQAVIDASRTGMTDATRRAMVGHGEDLMENLRTTFGQIDSEEREFLEQSKQEAESVARLTYLVISAGTLTSVVIFMAVLLGLNRAEAGRSRADVALRASEERFRIAAETTNDAVYEWDLKQSVQWVGKIDDMLGYEPGAFPRTLDGWAGSVHPEDIEHTMAAVQAHLEGRAPYVAEYRVRRKDGVYRWWSARGAAARAPDGKPIRWIGSVTDITERKRADEALRQHTEELRVRNETLTRFNRVAVGRELRMIELKQEVNELCRRLGERPRHALTSPQGGNVPSPGPEPAPAPPGGGES